MERSKQRRREGQRHVDERCPASRHGNGGGRHARKGQGQRQGAQCGMAQRDGKGHCGCDGCASRRDSKTCQNLQVGGLQGGQEPLDDMGHCWKLFCMSTLPSPAASSRATRPMGVRRPGQGEAGADGTGGQGYRQREEQGQSRCQHSPTCTSPQACHRLDGVEKRAIGAVEARPERDASSGPAAWPTRWQKSS
jgi:hypothetical protein